MKQKQEEETEKSLTHEMKMFAAQKKKEEAETKELW